MPPTVPELLRSLLAGHDIPCPVCRYNLRGSAGPNCPECGARLEVRVGSIDLKLGPWIACVLAVAIPLGFTAILTMIAAVGSQRSVSWSPRDWMALWGMLGLTLLYSLALMLICSRRPGFLRRPPGSQWRRAAGLTAAMMLTLVVTVGTLVRFL